MLPAAGIHPSVPFSLYGDWPAANFSLLKYFDRSALHARHAIENPKERTKALRMGHALHVATFEPARFAKECVTIPDFNCGKTEGKEGHRLAIEVIIGREVAMGLTKAEREAMVADAGITLMDASELEELRGMGDAIRNCRAAARLVSVSGECEVSCIWQDPATGLDCKARFDKRASVGGQPAIVELKSCQDARSWQFGKNCANFLYHAQAAHYRRGHHACTGVLPRHYIIAVESAAPHGVAVYTLSAADLQTGELLTRRWLDQYAKCIETGNWPGYPDESAELQLPSWSQQVEEVA